MSVSSKGADTIDQPPDQLFVLGCRCGGLKHAVGDEVADEYACHAHRYFECRGDLSDRERFATAQQHTTLLEEPGLGAVAWS
jgi:hypothetical protein